MITLSQLKEFLLQYGITAPDFILQCIIDTVDAIEPCLTAAGKTDCEKILIASYACALLVISQGATRVDSEKLPSGAARSYDVTSFKDQQKMLYNNLQALDTGNCTGAIIPYPADGAFFAVVGAIC